MSPERSSCTRDRREGFATSHRAPVVDMCDICMRVTATESGRVTSRFHVFCDQTATQALCHPVKPATFCSRTLDRRPTGRSPQQSLGSATASGNVAAPSVHRVPEPHNDVFARMNCMCSSGNKKCNQKHAIHVEHDGHVTRRRRRLPDRSCGTRQPCCYRPRDLLYSERGKRHWFPFGGMLIVQHVAANDIAQQQWV